MSKISCNAVRDILPLYVDGVVSEETQKEIADHLRECSECQNEYVQLKKELTLPANPDLHSESANALKSMKHTMAKKKIIISVISILATLSLVIAGYFVVKQVDVVHDYVFPELNIVVDNSTSDWQPAMLYKDDVGIETTDILMFDSIFYNKEIVNDGNSDFEVMIRILDTNGNIIIDNLLVQPGQSVSIKQLESNTEYKIEAKTAGVGKVILNIV